MTADRRGEHLVQHYSLDEYRSNHMASVGRCGEGFRITQKIEHRGRLIMTVD
jgi:hypothetical protein